MAGVILAVPMLLLFVLNGAYILYRFSASKIRRYIFVIFGFVTGLLPLTLVTLMDQSSWCIFLLELILYTLFLQYFRSKNLKISVFLSIFTLTFCYFVKMFVSIFIVEHLFQVKDGAIGGVIGDFCVIPAYYLLLKCLAIDPKCYIIADQEWDSDYLEVEDNTKGTQAERDIEQEQNRLIIFSDILMILFYLYNNFVRLTDFGSHFNFNYVVFVYVFLFLVMLYSINVKYKEWENQKLLKYKDYLLSGLATYTKEVDKSYQSVRMFRHDFTNILVSMRATIETQEIEAVRKTYGEILERSHVALNENRREVTKLANLKVLELKSVLSAKILQAEIREVIIELEIPEVIDNIGVEKLDIVRLIGIMLDNAIDAAVETEGKQPIVKVAIFNKGTARYYIVENDMVHEKLPTHLIFEDGYSTKGNHRGHGLANLEAIVNDYPSVSYRIQAKNYKFRIELEMS
jgi:two-component system, LytTR family, sensor histidine kinase AgrC